MIVIERISWWRLIAVWRGSTMERVWPRLAIVMFVAIVITEIHEQTRVNLGVLTPLPFTIIGLALGVFLGFRNNTSYDRFWEGRKLWGELVNTTRSLARAVLLLVDASEQGARPTPRQRELVRLVAAFPHVFRQHLRNEVSQDEYAHLLGEADTDALTRAHHRPNALLDALARQVRLAWQAGGIDLFHVPVIEQGIATLTTVLGACERIRNTPIPISYTVLMHRIVASYVLFLPFGLLETTGVYTPLVVLLTAYAFLGLDAIGDELENPFGVDPNDLPLSALSRSIEIDLRAMLGETELPLPLAPRDRVLS
jgi:ion channel-forming bestrophin family protein